MSTTKMLQTNSIASFWSFDPNLPPGPMLDCMLSACPGFDRATQYPIRIKGFALGSPAHQPFWSPDRSFCLAADVRLDNRADLCQKLELPASTSDLQILRTAWSLWRQDCVQHLIGAFAFAVYTPASQTLFIARDHTGERPLFFAHTSEFFAVAGTQQALLALPQIPRDFNPAKLLDYVTFSGTAADATYFRHIHRVAPAESLTITPTGHTRHRYWDPMQASPTRYRSDAEYAEAARHLIDSATASRINNASAVGSHLTAGLDSSTVTASAAGQLAQNGRYLTAFTAVPLPAFPGTTVNWGMPDEGSAAACVAGHYDNIRHIRVHSGGRNLMHDMQSIIAASSEPMFNPLNFTWMLAILERARTRGIDTMLTGQVGNCTISYDGTLALRDMIQQGQWLRAFQNIATLRIRRETSIKAALATAFDSFIPTWARTRPSTPPRPFGLTVLHPQLAAQHRTAPPSADTIANERRNFTATIDLGATNAALAAVSGIQSLDPTGDKRLFDFCFSIPVEQFLAQGQSRSLVRRAMQDRLPASTLRRTTRGFQGADWHLTLGAALPAFHAEFEQIERSPAANRYLDLPYLRRLLQTWPATNFDTRQALQTWNHNLTKALALGHFLRTHEHPAVAL